MSLVDTTTGELVEVSTGSWLQSVDSVGQELAQIETVAETAQFITEAEAAKVCARAVGDRELQNRYALRSLLGQRHAGKMLAAMELAKASPGNQHTGKLDRGHRDSGPTLADLGVSGNDSKRWQKLASVPDETFVAHVEKVAEDCQDLTTAGLLRTWAAAKKAEMGEKRSKAWDDAEPATADLRVGDFREVLSDLDGSVDLILTDPPYPREYLPLYSDLAVFAAKALKDGGVLAVMCGQSWLPEVMAALTSGPLEYRWTLAYLTPGGQSVQVWPRRVNCFWKPVVVLTKGPTGDRWMGDVAKSSVNDNDKRFDEWGQSESGMADLLKRLAEPGMTVCDPFLGGGTTAVVATTMGCPFVGCDIEKADVDGVTERLR